MNNYDFELDIIIKVVGRYIKAKYAKNPASLILVDFILNDAVVEYYKLHPQASEQHDKKMVDKTDVIKPTGQIAFGKLHVTNKTKTDVKSPVSKEPQIDNYGESDNLDFDDKINKIIKEYLNGVSIIKLSAKYKISPATIRNHVKYLTKF